MKRPLAPLTVVASLFASSVAFAQTAPGFALDRFDPSERGSLWFAADSLEIDGSGRPAIGVIGSYAASPLVAYNANGSQSVAIVKELFVLHPGGSVVVWDRLRLGLDIPVALVDDGTTAIENGITYKAPTGLSMGDVRLSADVRLIGRASTPFTLAIGVPLYLPSGSAAAYMGDGSLRAEPRVSAAGQVAWFAYAAHVGVLIRPSESGFGTTPLGTELTFNAAAGFHHGVVQVGPEVFGSTVASGAFQTATTPFEALLGAHVDLPYDFRLGAGIGPGIGRGLGTPEWRGLFSAEWAPPASPAILDADHDGIPDSEDACPTLAGLKTADAKTNGCPSDRDGDGIPDSEDACPLAPGVRTNDPRTNGCPPDGDGDGVPDAEDACPTIPGMRTNDPKTNGCPSDRDGDGVYDFEDACPILPGIRTNNPKTNGCPSDRDGDGIYDTEDACPDDPGPRDPDPKRNGCPPAFVSNGQIHVRDPFKFRFAKTELDPAGDPILEAVLKVLTDHPEFKKVHIEGYTDNVGNAAQNLKLSEGRAASVRKWLIAHGIAAARLTSAGYGPASPVDTNATEEGRRNNRRVEFHIEGETAPPGATPAPPKSTSPNAVPVAPTTN
jgi:OOP family OmpA-OmpF porin